MLSCFRLEEWAYASCKEFITARHRQIWTEEKAKSYADQKLRFYVRANFERPLGAQPVTVRLVFYGSEGRLPHPREPLDFLLSRFNSTYT
jgi:hypothetical protein